MKHQQKGDEEEIYPVYEEPTYDESGYEQEPYKPERSEFSNEDLK